MARVLALFLALTLALTSQAVAIARGQSAAVGEMVICTGGHFVTISIDAQGNPTGPAHICPDAIAHFGAAALPAILPLHVAGTPQPAVLPPLPGLKPSLPPGIAQARAPPPIPA